MPGPTITTTLTVYFDGQFWIAWCERVDEGQTYIARHVFGPEPSLPEIGEFVAGRGWSQLRFVRTQTAALQPPAVAANPKRRQRQAAKKSRETTPSTKSQAALKAAIEEIKANAQGARREQRAEEAEKRWAERRAKHKEKHRGH